MDFLKKLQSLSETKRKIIFWSVIVIIGLILIFFWIKISENTIKSFKTEDFRKRLNLPSFEKEMEGLKENIENLENINEEE